MTPARLTVLALLWVSLAAFLFDSLATVHTITFTPTKQWDTFVPGNRQAREWGAALGPRTLSILFFLVMAPTWVVPGLAAVGVWWFRVVPENAAVREAQNKDRRQEARLESFLEGIDKRWLAADGGVDNTVRQQIRTDALKVMQQLDDGRKNRLLRFLELLEIESEEGQQHSENPGQTVAGFLYRRRTLATGWVRPLVWLLSCFGTFCLCWGSLSAATIHWAQPFFALNGITTGPQEAWTGLLGCSGAAITVMAAALGLVLLARLDRREKAHYAASVDALRTAMLERLRRRLQKVSSGRNRTVVPATSLVSRLLRAHILITLPLLDGSQRGHLLRELHAMGRLHGEEALDLRGTRFDGAVLSQADLSGARLAGVHLSGADLQGARLPRADLRGCRLAGADLRRADLTGADLYRAVLWHARLHQAQLSQTRLTEAALDSANLWQADLTGAELTGARLTAEQLASAKTTASTPSQVSAA